MSSITLGTIIRRKHPQVLPGGLIYWERGELARIVGFTLGVSGVDVMIEALDESTMDNVVARSLLDAWEVVENQDGAPTLH
jgi:hypothetical protein